MPAPNQLAIQIRLEGANQVVTAVQQVQSQFNTFQQTLQAGFNLNLGAKLAETVLQSVVAFRQAVSEGLRYAAGLKDMSIQSGLTVEAVQVLGQAAALSGAGIENVRTALTNLRQAATAAQAGNDDLSAAFKQLGLDAAKVTNLPLEAQLEAVARGFAASGQDGRTFSALVRLLGERDAPRLQGMLQELAQRGLGGMAQALRENGALLDSELIDKADQLDDRWGELGTKFKATFARLGILLKPIMEGLIKLLSISLDLMLSLVTATRNLVTAMGAIGAVLTGADWKTAWQEFLNTANGGALNLKGKPSPGSGPDNAPQKTTGPTLAEMADEQRKLALSMRPLWQQRAAATDDVALAEKEMQRVMDEGNQRQLIDAQALMAASLALTKAKADQVKIDGQIAAEIASQQKLGDQIAEMEASFLPLEDQRLRARQALAEVEQESVRLQADEKADANAILAAELKRLSAKQALAALDEKIARDHADKGIQAALDAADATARRLAAERAALDGDFTRTAAEKWAERKRILGEEIANQQKLLDVLVAKRDAALNTGDKVTAGIYDQSARQVGTGIDTLKNQQAGLGPDPSSIGQQLTAAITSAQTAVGSLAEQTARAFSTVGDSIRTSLGSALADIALRASSFKDAMLGFGQAIATSFINAGAQMVADWIYSHVIMQGVRSAFHALGIGQTAAAEGAKTGIQAQASAARIGIVVAEEGIKAGAVATGAAVTTGIVATEAGAQAAVTGPAAVLRSIMELGPIAGPIVLGVSIAAMLALVSSLFGGFAEGGLVNGPGTGTSDSIPARLSNGEFVVRAATVSRFGAGFFNDLNAGALNLAALPGGIAGNIPAYAGGGYSGAAGGVDLPALVDALAKKIKITNVIIPDDRAATRIARRSAAADDIVNIVRSRKSEIFRQGP